MFVCRHKDVRCSIRKAVRERVDAYFDVVVVRFRHIFAGTRIYLITRGFALDITGRADAREWRISGIKLAFVSKFHLATNRILISAGY